MLESICAAIEQQIRELASGASRREALARALLAIGTQEQEAVAAEQLVADGLLWRLAWLVYVLAPSLDESFIVTTPMRLEMIADAGMSLETILDDLRAAELEAPAERVELAAMVALQLRLPTAAPSALRPHVVAAVRSRRSDPGVAERVIASITRGNEPPMPQTVEDADVEVVLSLELPRSRRYGAD